MDIKSLLGKINQGVSIMDAVFSSDNVADPKIALAGFLDRRISTPQTFQESNDYFLYPSFRDFPLIQRREVLSFPSGKNHLTGYLYKTLSPKGIIIFVHGYNSLADGYMSQFVTTFTESDYDVFAIDLTCCGRSEGLYLDGMFQSALDVVAAEEYIKSRVEYRFLPVFLLGHSWGAYGCLASLNLSSLPLGVFAFSAFSNPMDLMLGNASTKVGNIVDLTKESLEEAMKERSAEYWNLSAIDGINKSKDTYINLYHAKNDRTVVYGKYSVAGNNFENPNVRTTLIKNRDHNNLFYTDESAEYEENVKKTFKEKYPKQKRISKMPKEMQEEFLHSFDRKRMAVLNANIFNSILDTMDKLTISKIIDDSSL